ncbi:MAG: hypothetical protein IJO54_06950 [Oscillospiraceae bacterium]|nr:hypothetical protein [Oscillospiraceae bacterium]
MTVFFAALAAFAVVAAFALGFFVGCGAADRHLVPKKVHNAPADSTADRLTMEKQLENIMNYHGK